MIIRDHLRQHFFDQIKHDHVLMIANVDVDAVCTSQILMELLTVDDITFTLVPVTGWEMLCTAVKDHSEHSRSMVFINCGGCRSLAELIKPHLIFYVLDSRRPFDLDNIFAPDNIRVIISDEEVDELAFPQLGDVRTVDSSDSEDCYNSDDDEVSQTKRSRTAQNAVDGDVVSDYDDDDVDNVEMSGGNGHVSGTVHAENIDDDNDGSLSPESESVEAVRQSNGNRKRVYNVAERIEAREIKRHRAVAKQQRRSDILWSYYESTWYSVASAITMLELADEIGRARVEMFWCAVVAECSQLVENLISMSAYTTVCFERLRPFLRRFAYESELMPHIEDLLRITFENEITLPLYRHWSIYNSMMADDFFICKTKVWQQRGAGLMNTLLTNLEITLEESHQVFKTILTDRREAILEKIGSAMTENFATFVANIAFYDKYSSCDFARAVGGRISYGIGRVESPYDRFIGGLEIVRRFNEAISDVLPLSKAIESYKGLITSVVNLVIRAITHSLIISTGSYYLLTITQAEEAMILNTRHFLSIFTDYVFKAFHTASRIKRRRNQPLIVCIALCGQDSGWFQISGVMPLNTLYADNHRKSFIGRAFEKVIDQYVKKGIRKDSFDMNVVYVEEDEKARFFDGLQTVLESI